MRFQRRRVDCRMFFPGCELRRPLNSCLRAFRFGRCGKGNRNNVFTELQSWSIQHRGAKMNSLPITHKCAAKQSGWLMTPAMCNQSLTKVQMAKNLLQHQQKKTYTTISVQFQSLIIARLSSSNTSFFSPCISLDQLRPARV